MFPWFSLLLFVKVYKFVPPVFSGIYNIIYKFVDPVIISKRIV